MQHAMLQRPQVSLGLRPSMDQAHNWWGETPKATSVILRKPEPGGGSISILVSHALEKAGERLVSGERERVLEGDVDPGSADRLGREKSSGRRWQERGSGMKDGFRRQSWIRRHPTVSWLNGAY